MTTASYVRDAIVSEPRRQTPGNLLWRAVVEQSPDAIVLTRGPDHLIQSANAAFCELVGATRDLLVSRPLAKPLSDWGRTAVEMADRVYASGQPESSTGRESPACGGAVSSLCCSAWPLSTSSHPRDRGVALFVRKPSNPATVRAGLTRLAAEKDARAAVGEREDQIFTIAHDLRGALHSIVFSATALKRSIEQKASPDEIRAIGRIAANADRMDRLLGVMLEAARGGACSAPGGVTWCDLAEVVRETVDRLDDARRRRVRIEAPHPPFAVGADPIQMERAVANLIGNGLKYSGEDSEVRVKLSQDEEAVSLEVVDLGIGVAAEDIPKLFGRFSRTRGAEKFPGMGLGLYSVRRVAEQCGGRVEVRTRVGEGSTFRLVLPRARSARAE